MESRDRQKSLPGFGSDAPLDSPPNPLPDAPPDGSPNAHNQAEVAPVEQKPSVPGPPPDSLEGQTVYVVDSHSLIYQVFHALPEMTSPRGEPVGAVFGFVRDLLYLLEVKRPDYLLCAFDLPGKTFRHEMYDQYKIQRSAMPEDLIPQIPAIRRVLEAMEIPALACESFEADDVLATVARHVGRLGGQCYVVTSDKDCRQLITDRVKLYNIRKDAVYDRDSLQSDWGVTPEQVVDFQALVGDSVDNVPGVPLIGPKIARELIGKYGTLDEVLDHAGEVSGAKRKQNLLEGRQQAMLSRDLVRLSTDVPVDIDWAAGRVGSFDREAVLALFSEFGFHSLGDKLDALPGVASERKTRPQLQPKYHTVDTPETLETFVAELGRQKLISLDTETTSLRPRRAEIVGYSFAFKDDEAWYLPVRAPAGETCLDPDATLEALRPVLENPAIEKIGQNLKYDMVVLRSAGLELAGVVFDTMLASYLLDAGERNHNLDDMAKRYLDHETTKISQLIGTGKNQKRMDEVPVSQVSDYAGEDALLPLLLRPILAQRMSEAGLDKLFGELEIPLIDVLVELEYNGIKVNVERLGELSRRFGQRIDALVDEIYQLAGHEFNIASRKQLAEVLFDELKLPITKKTKTGPSTDAGVLEELAQQHPLPAKIIEYRQFAKLKSTYVDALPELVNPKTGRIHASFNQVVTATGRLSSSDPNLQNIPVRTESGREIRSAFVPEGSGIPDGSGIPGESGWTLLAADYSQIELRVLAHFSGDQRLSEAFAADEDIHARVAGQVNSVPLEEVTAEMRREAKAVNFGVIYGQSAFGLAKQLRIDQDEAAQFIDAYFAGYPGIEKFLDRTLADCREKGYVSTILGRRRAIQGVRADAGRGRNLPERTAINTVIQGSAADLIKLAMLAVHRRLRRESLKARMLLQIHDELIFEVPSNELHYLGELVTEEMIGAKRLEVPLKVDLKVGPNWADAESWN